MRVFRFGTIVLALACVYGGFIAIRLIRTPQPSPNPPERPPATISTVKADLCKLAAAERAYFKMTGSYATEAQLRSDGQFSIPLSGRWPYHYFIKLPSPNLLTIVATRYASSDNRPLAVVTDERGQVCTVSFDLPRPTHQLDNPAQDWRKSAPIYECEACQTDR